MRKMRTIFLVALLVIVFTATVFASSRSETIPVSYNNIKVYVDQKLTNLKDANGNTVEPFIYNGTTYLPVRAVSEALGKEVEWDQNTKSVYVGGKPTAAREGTLAVPTKDANANIGKAYSTKWFDFTIKSMKTIDVYGQYKPTTGNQLVDVLVSETGTSKNSCTMGTFDFYVDATNLEDYIYPLKPLDKAMMPESFVLSNGQSVEYHMIYEIPKDIKNAVLCYTEVDDAGVALDSFAFKVN